MFLLSFQGMLRASRNIWPRGPYPNKKPVSAPRPPPRLVKALLQTRPVPPLAISPLSKSCPLCPKYFRSFASPDVSRSLPMSLFLSDPLTAVVAAAQKKGHPLSLASVVFSQSYRQRSTSSFLVEEEIDCVSSWILSPASCAVIGLCFAIVSF